MKLDESEQKEKQLETYKMMSAISGISVNEIIGEDTKSNYNEKDCLVKQFYLKNMINPITSNELWNLLKSQGYDGKNSTFRGMLNQYQRYKYVRKVNEKKPFLYQITQLGNEHIKNPYLAREEGVRRYKEFQLNKLKEIIENYPELFKSIYENVHGAQNSIFPAGNVVAGGSQYSPNDIGSELHQELESQIFTPDFFKNADEQKLKSLVDGILDNSLSDEQKKQLILDAFGEAMKSNKTMVFKQQEYQSSKPIGERKYYEYLVAAIDHPVTKSLYEKIPFRFMQVGKEIRLRSRNENGLYRNNKDGIELEFEEVNQKYFQNRMTIKIKSNYEKRELEFYYVGGNFGLKITTISFDDYSAIKNNNIKTTLKINPAQ